MTEPLEEKVIILKESVKYIELDLKDLKQKVVIRVEFEPIKKLVYGLVGIILTAVIVALVSLVIK